jgi:hypothetical protein
MCVVVDRSDVAQEGAHAGFCDNGNETFRLNERLGVS